MTLKPPSDMSLKLNLIIIKKRKKKKSREEKMRKLIKEKRKIPKENLKKLTRHPYLMLMRIKIFL
jgi:hypothetical protein